MLSFSLPFVSRRDPQMNRRYLSTSFNISILVVGFNSSVTFLALSHANTSVLIPDMISDMLCAKRWECHIYHFKNIIKFCVRSTAEKWNVSCRQVFWVVTPKVSSVGSKIWPKKSNGLQNLSLRFKGILPHYGTSYCIRTRASSIIAVQFSSSFHTG